MEDDKYDFICDEDAVLQVDTSQGDVIVSIPVVNEDEIIVSDYGPFDSMDGITVHMPTMPAFEKVATEKDIVAVNTENIELRKRIEFLEEELESLKRRVK